MDVERLASGCCGLAGNFGFERGHAAVSEACAESVLLPAIRAADPDIVVLADGFSCRTQIHELDSGGRDAVHLAELLDRALRGAHPAADDQPVAPRRRTTILALAAAVAGAGALGLAVPSGETKPVTNQRCARSRGRWDGQLR